MKLSLTRNRFRCRSSRTGSAMVEMAICFPVFMLILMGIIEFGRAMSVSQMLNSASRIGCRAAILDGSSNSSVTSIIKQHVTSTIGCEPSVITVAIIATSSRNGSALSDVSHASTGDMIKLDVSVRFADVSWAVKDWMGGSRIRGQCSMQHE
jgi:Flp pilus assembly protein TadG